MAYMSSKEDSDDSDNDVTKPWYRGNTNNTDSESEDEENTEKNEKNENNALANAIRVQDTKGLRKLIQKMPRKPFRRWNYSVNTSALHLLVQHKTDTTELRAILGDVKWLTQTIDEEASDEDDCYTYFTALSYLCTHFHEPHGWSTLDWLLRQGADPRLPTFFPAVARAINYNHHELVIRLLPQCRLDQRLGRMWLVQTFNVAIRQQNVVMLRLLMEQEHFEMPRECVAQAVAHGNMLLFILDRLPSMLNEPLLTPEHNTRPLDLALRDGTLSLVYALVARGARCHIGDAFTKFHSDVMLQAVAQCWKKTLRQFLQTEQVVALVVEMLAWPSAQSILRSSPH